jgi:hypothetical protein
MNACRCRRNDDNARDLMTALGRPYFVDEVFGG